MSFQWTASSTGLRPVDLVLATRSLDSGAVFGLRWLPALWSLLVCAAVAVKRTSSLVIGDNGRSDHKAASSDPSSFRGLGAWIEPFNREFVNEGDILAAAKCARDGASDSAEDEDDGVSIDVEQLLPSAPIALRILPFAEAIGWLAYSAWLLVAADEVWSTEQVLALSTGAIWLTISIKETLSPDHLPPLHLLVLFFLFLFNSAAAIMDSLHTFLTTPGDYPSILPTLQRVPDLACVATLIVAIVLMPLRAPPGSILKAQNHSSEHGRPPSPEDTNTLLGSLSYSWMGEIMSLATERPLQASDVWSLSLSNQSEVLSRRFSALKERSLLGRMLHASARDVLLDLSLKQISVIFGYLRPYFIQKILECLTTDAPNAADHQSSEWTPRQLAYIYAAFAFLSMAGRSLAELQNFHYARRGGMRLRSELTVLVFEKALTRKDMAGRAKKEDVADEEASVGKVIGLIGDDTNRILRMGCDAHLIYGSFTEIVLALVFLYSLMGYSSVVGLGILAVAAPANYALGKRSIKIAAARSAARDERQATLQELIVAIRQIKLFGWASPWIQKVEEKRAVELDWMIREWINRGFLTALWATISIAVPFSTFFCFVKLQKEELTVAIAFTALALFSMVRGPLNQIPEFGIRILQTKVSIRRIESFLEEDDVSAHATPQARARDCSTLAFRSATLKWPSSGDSEPWYLRDLSIDFPPGALSIVCGQTGSGKTSLLLALLGELDIVSGEVDLPKSVAYAPQNPFLESDSIRANILFGTPYNSERYQATLEACALIRDLESFSAGDRAQIGERGVSLSGGQKARIALARALYSPAEHVLLDDVLAAVDSHTAKHLFWSALTGPLMRGRTCVLVTHHVDLVMAGAAYRVELVNGRVAFQGPTNSTIRSFEDASLPDTPIDTLSADPISKDETPLVAEGWTTGPVNLSIYKTSIFSSLLVRVVKSPPRWFDITPNGQITNRLTNDMATVDEGLASNFNNFALHSTGMTAALLVTSVILPISVIPTLAFASIYSIIFVRYLRVSRDLNRIGATTASPIFSGFQEVLHGITTIRAFGRERAFRAIMCARVDETLAMWYCGCTLAVWLSIRTQLLSACCLLATATFAIYSEVSPGLAGIAIVSSQTLVMSLNSLERITEYLELPQERSGGTSPPALWPSSSCAGALIKVEGLVIRYSPELPDVLHGISFEIKPRERVAIVGRTGSGKSTLATSLLRYTEPAQGRILIDGLDITKIGLEDLRQRVTFLPQDAMLFSGTVRDNLDPLNEHTAEECLEALGRVHLTGSTGSQNAAPLRLPVGERSVDLAAAVSSGGHNFSSGQRQLIALARALLRDSRLIIFDESTAAIDFALDAHIQAAIRTEFRDACLITIAHRLRTIIDFDRVMVLYAGTIVEFDTPNALFALPDGAFHGLCKESGDYEELRRIVEEGRA